MAEQIQAAQAEFQLPDFVKRAGREAVNGFFASLLCPIWRINPLSAAIFAASVSEMQSLLEEGIRKRLSVDGSTPEKVYLFVVTYLFSAIYSISMSVALGFRIHLFAAITLSAVMIPTNMITEYIAAHYFPNNRYVQALF